MASRFLDSCTSDPRDNSACGTTRLNRRTDCTSKERDGRACWNHGEFLKGASIFSFASFFFGSELAYVAWGSNDVEGSLMLARNYFGVGFMRGLNSAAEVFAPYSGGHERSQLEQMRSDWRRLGRDLRTALANVPQEISEPRPATSRGPILPTASIISAHWSGPLPPPAELEKIDQIIPGGADRLLRMAEKEQTHRIDDAKRGQYLGWSLAAGAVIAAAVVSLCHGPWQVSVALVGIPVLGAVQALIQGRKEKSARRAKSTAE